MKKIIYPTAALLATFAFTSVNEVKADSNTLVPVAGEETVQTSTETTVNASLESKADPSLDERRVNPSAVTEKAEAEASSPRVEKLLDEMTVEQKVAQMLMPDFRRWQTADEKEEHDVTQLNSEIATAIDQYDFGGVILFANNVQETKQTLELTQSIQKAAMDNKANNGKLPLLLAIDQEGGIVYRLGSGTALPGNMALGATNDPALANEAGQIIGRELSALGLNVDFAPVLDTNNNPQNPVIGLRSFSSDPERVARLGIPMMKGIQSYNVAVAAKHFPGHGDTAVDSHTGLPLVDKSLDELEKLELYPFKKAMDAGVDLLMTAHIQYPQVEKDQVISKSSKEAIYIPATLSDDVLTGLVREKYGYKGVIVSDAMGMDAIAKNFGEIDAVKMAIKAGVDLVLMPTTLRKVADLDKINQIIQAVSQAVAKGEIDESRLDESVRRILTLKEKRGVLDFKLTDRTVKKAEQAVGSDLNRELERKIAAAAVTVVKNDDGVLPFKVSSKDHVLLLGAYENEIPGLKLGMRRLLADHVLPEGLQYTVAHYTKQSTLDDFKSSLEQASHIIVVSEIGSEKQLNQEFWLTKLPTELVDFANSKGKKIAVMSISKPYDVANYPNAKAIVAVYGNKGMDPTEGLKPENAFGPNIPAGVEVIFNGREHIGRLPVDIPKIVDGKLSTTEFAYRIGHGLFYKAEAQYLPPSKQTKPERPERPNQQVPEQVLLTNHPNEQKSTDQIEDKMVLEDEAENGKIKVSSTSETLPKTGNSESVLASIGLVLLSLVSRWYVKKKN